VELSVPLLAYALLTSNIEITLTLSIDIAIKFSIVNAKYRNAKIMLCFLKIGNNIVAITIDIIPLKHNNKVEVMISFEFSDVVVINSSENRTGPCRI
jgi:hypothetical protein